MYAAVRTENSDDDAFIDEVMNQVVREVDPTHEKKRSDISPNEVI